MLRSISDRISRTPVVVFCLSVALLWDSLISVCVLRNAIGCRANNHCSCCNSNKKFREL